VTHLLAIDPGLRELGAAGFQDGVLTSVAVVANPERKARDARAWMAMARETLALYPTTDELVIEMMVVRSGRRDVNPDDLLQLVGIAGVLFGLYDVPEPVAIRPEHWKGRLKKRIHHPRIIRALAPAELEVLEAAMTKGTVADYIAECRLCRGKEVPNALIHNAIDAIGIGLHALDRK